MLVVNDLAAALAETAKKLANTLENIQQSKQLADAYAQAVTYGMFLRQLYGGPLTDILKLLPFLSLFDGVACYYGHESIRSIVNEIDRMLQATDMESLKQHFGSTMNTDDAAIHFYEHFLAAYNPDQRKSRGVFYTPQPVVQYMIRAVDDILRQEFNLPDGLADNSKIVSDGQTIHRVQVLDPAMGTGTFLAEAVKHIHAYHVENNRQKAWKDYVTDDLLPRLHGVEVMMTPYLTAHLKFATLIEDTGVTLKKMQYADLHHENVFETDGQTLPAMVVLGNPPYNVSTTNKGQHAKKLIEKYKENLGEKKTNLDDDYIKFIALGQQCIENNPLQEGIVAYITNNSFLEGITHRNMRRSLLKTFDKIYILNLHGDVRKKETAPDGSKDENVFNIRQGTSINIFVRSPLKNENTPCRVFYSELFGKRSDKFHFLETQHLNTSNFTEIVPAKNYYFFVPKNLSAEKEYNKGFSVAQLFLVYNSGIKTDRDPLFIDDDKERLAKRIKKLLSGNIDEHFRQTYRVEDSHSYKITKLIQGKHFDPSCLCRVTYRPFDEKWIYYDPAIISRPGKRVMQHMQRDNIALLTSRLIPSNHDFNRVFVTKTLADGHAISDQTYVFPLYVYDSLGRQNVNVNMDIVDKIAHKIGKELNPLEIFDYIYGVLHDLQYRTKYKEFLNIDFPRVPYPKNAAIFNDFAERGARLRSLHLLEEVPSVETTFPIAGSNVVENVRYEKGNVYINKEQYFGNISVPVWECEVGDYRPAQKYLKDRKGRAMRLDEIQHYQTIIAVLEQI